MWRWMSVFFNKTLFIKNTWGPGLALGLRFRVNPMLAAATCWFLPCGQLPSTSEFRASGSYHLAAPTFSTCVWYWGRCARERCPVKGWQRGWRTCLLGTVLAATHTALPSGPVGKNTSQGSSEMQRFLGKPPATLTPHWSWEQTSDKEITRRISKPQKCRLSLDRTEVLRVT